MDKPTNPLVLILAGGKDTRVQSITRGRFPKHMIPINGKPFIYYILDYLTSLEVTKIYLSISKKFENYSIDGIYRNSIDYNRKADVVSIIEQDYLGTGGAVQNVLQYIKNCFKDTDSFIFNIPYLIVVNGDTYIEWDFTEIPYINTDTSTEFFLQQYIIPNEATTGLFVHGKSLLEGVNDSLYPVLTGVRVCSTNYLINVCKDWKPPFDIDRDVFRVLVEQNEPYARFFRSQFFRSQFFRSHSNWESFVDIGTPEGITKAENLLGRE